MLAFVPPSRAAFSFPSLSCVRRVAAETSAEGSRLSTSISIHAPRVGSDLLTFLKMSAILILESENRGCEPSVFRPGLFSTTSDSFYFNPRSPCGERPKTGVTAHRNAYFNPRSPCGERRASSTRTRNMRCYFNPRSPCGERQLVDAPEDVAHAFQSTLPVWGATLAHHRRAAVATISIHAPRVGSDGICRSAEFGGRRFQSTLPVWGATGVRSNVFDQ